MTPATRSPLPCPPRDEEELPKSFRFPRPHRLMASGPLSAASAVRAHARASSRCLADARGRAAPSRPGRAPRRRGRRPRPERFLRDRSRAAAVIRLQQFETVNCSLQQRPAGPESLGFGHQRGHVFAASFEVAGVGARLQLGQPVRSAGPSLSWLGPQAAGPPPAVPARPRTSPAARARSRRWPRGRRPRRCRRRRRLSARAIPPAVPAGTTSAGRAPPSTAPCEPRSPRRHLCTWRPNSAHSWSASGWPSRTRRPHSSCRCA